MKIYFIFSNLNPIVLAVWLVFLAIVTLRFFWPESKALARVSYHKLFWIALGINVFIGLFITWGQYYVWAHGNILTQSLLDSPLSKEAPLYDFFRPLFSHHLGYFAYYVLGRTWLNILILFLVSGALYFLFKAWNKYRGNFLQEGPLLLLILMLAVGYPAILVFIPLGFIFAILLLLFFYARKVLKREFPRTVFLNIEPAFILAAFLALIFARGILNML